MQEAIGGGRRGSASPGCRRCGAAVAAMGAAGLIALGALISPAGALAQERVYEKVSPNEKNLGDVVRVPMAAPDGNTVAFTSTAAAEGAVHAMAAKVARRTATGWTVTNALPRSAAPPHSAAALLTTPFQFSEDFRKLAFETTLQMVEDDDDDQADVFVFDGLSGDTDFLQRGFTVVSAENPASQFVGASRDLGHVFFRSHGVGLAGAPSKAVYERLPDGTVRVASVLENGTAVEADGAAKPGQRTGLRLLAAAARPVREHGRPHVVSDDGSRLFFRETTGGGSRLYVRIDGSRTVAVSKDRRIIGGTGQVVNATFVGATADGSRVWFTAGSPLTDDAPAQGGLYRFDVDAEQLTFLTPETTSTAGGPRIQNAMVSDDGSRVYLIAQGILAPGGVDGQNNAYVLDAGGIRHIGIVDFFGEFARVSRNGRYALLVTSVSLNGAPTNGMQAIYLYDAVEDKITCVSCRPDGTPSQGNASVDGFPFGNNVAGDPEVTNARALTDDGQVYFTTEDRLLPADVSAARDVYGYHDGKLELISSGRSAYNSDYADNSDDGRDVFFFTRDRLVPDDNDGGLIDLYDARRGGGFPSSNERPADCTGDGCQDPPLRRPALSPPASASVSGPGNVVPDADDEDAVERSFSVVRLSASRRRQLARTGRTTVSVRLRGGGAIRVRAQARIGGRTRTIGSGSRTVRQTRSVTAQVPLRLTATARRQLRRGGRLRVTIEVRVSGVEAAKRTTLNLEGARS